MVTFGSSGLLLPQPYVPTLAIPKDEKINGEGTLFLKYGLSLVIVLVAVRPLNQVVGPTATFPILHTQ